MHRFFMPIAFGVLAFVLTATIVASLSLLSARVDNEAVTPSVRDSLQSGVATFPPKLEDRNMETGIDTWTDCLVLEIATYGEKDTVSALTRANFVGAPNEHPCHDLEHKVGGEPVKNGNIDYWRYWWGSAALLNLAIGDFGLSLETYQVSLKVITYIAILLVALTAFIRYRRAAWPLVPVVAALLFGFLIPLFGQSIAHAPGLIFGLLLVWAYMASGVDRATPRWQFVYVFIAGGLDFISICSTATC